MAHRTMSQLEQDKRELRREEERKLQRMEEQRRRSDELWPVAKMCKKKFLYVCVSDGVQVILRYCVSGAVF